MTLPIVPDQIAVNAQVAVTFDTAVNPSEGGINGRKSYRDQAIRNFTITIGPDDVADMKAILLAVRGNRWPLAIRDYSDYQLTAEPQTWTADTGGGTINLSKTYTPATGSRNYVQRILVADQRTSALLVKINGIAATSGTWTVSSTGVLQVNGLVSGDVVTVTGDYLVPVCFTDDAITLTLLSSGVFQAGDLHLREILEQELTDLTA